ncbi:SRPBCC family protein [Mucilaginibacter ginkgonis]|uniref:SRPBCC family protein n=1 Tax=Mucilaginibacter ginkgonis TaxID=2682091 RepID=A0A6I4HX10_9SPHI|nr:SRPBCC family protein [Mucilaginibacter ginkgonis]QQL48248.1 SRPBCC family protein [Mucilaginibacter ginkgonis]
MENAQKITVEVTVNAPVDKAWKYFSEPEHIVKWSFASEDWHTPHSENDLQVGGKFKSTMAAKDGSFSFDFGGTYTEIKEHEFIAYSLDDGRTVQITFASEGDNTKLTETFDAEDQNPVDMQQGGWQAILNNFKKYVEAN